MLEQKKKFILVILILLCISAAFSAVYLFRFTNDKESSTVISVQSPGDSSFQGKLDTKSGSDIYLYFSSADNSYLFAEKRNILHSDDSADFGRSIILELIKGPRKNLLRTIPEKTVLNAFYVADDGTAYADFSHEITDHHPGGSQSEYFTVYSIVNSLVYNVPGIKSVKILINGNEAVTLAGHIGLQSPIRADMIMVR